MLSFVLLVKLALTGHDKTAMSLNSECIIQAYGDYTAELDTAIKEHLETAKMFKGMSKIIQNELLDCILNIFRKEIELQMRTSEFVAIQCDEMSRITVEWCWYFVMCLKDQ